MGQYNNNNNNNNNNNKTSLTNRWRVIITILLSCFIASFLFFGFGSEHYFSSNRSFYIVTFLFVGTYFICWRQKKNEEDRADLFAQLKPPFLLAFFVFIVFLGCGLLAHNFSFLTALTASTAFLLPIIIVNSWMTYKNIPGQSFKTFKYSLALSNKKTVYLDSIPAIIKLNLNNTPGKESEFEVKLPANILFGVSFHHFIDGRNDNSENVIKVFDNHGNPYHWKFFILSWFGLKKTYIDPELTTRENGITRKALIVATRV